MFFPLSLLSWKPRQLVNGKHVEDKLEFFTLWYWWTPVVRKGVFLLTQKLSVPLPLTQKALICGAKGYEWWCKRHWKVVSETVCRGRMVAVKSSYGSSRKFVWQLRVFSVPELVAVRWFIAHVLPVVVVVSVVVKITSTCLLAAFHRQAILKIYLPLFMTILPLLPYFLTACSGIPRAVSSPPFPSRRHRPRPCRALSR